MEKAEDFDAFLKKQEERLAELQEPLKDVLQQKSLESESQFTTTPLNSFNGRIVEFESVVVKKDESEVAARRLFNIKKLILVISAIVLITVLLYLIYKPESADSKK